MPGVSMRFLPKSNCALICAAEFVGCATKKLEIGMDEPGVEPPAQVVPTELRCTAGTKTL